MLIVKRKIIDQFLVKNKNAEDAVKAWLKEAEHAHWKTPSDIKARYSSADFLKGNRVVFNIKGKHYRLIVRIQYEAKVVEIRYINTHKEYSRINAETI